MDIAPFLIVLVVVMSIFSTAVKTPEVAYVPSKTPGIELKQPSADSSTAFVEVDSSAIEKFIGSYAPGIHKEDVTLISRSIVESGKEFNIDPKLVTGLIAAESRFNKNAISPSGAQGLGQLMPATATSTGVIDSFDIKQNVMGTTRYIKLMLDRWQGQENQITLALASYKEGYGAVSRSNGNFSSDTIDYIQRILKVRNTI